MFASGIQLKAGNPLVQEQLPVESWGTNVVAMSFAGRTNIDLYRVLTAESNMVAIISANGTVVTNLAAGSNYEAELQGPVQFQSTKPIQVAQFANGNFFDYTVAEEGDPCETLLPPTGYYSTSYAIYSPPNDNVTGDFNENFVNIIVPQSATNVTLMDGVLVTATNFVPILNSGYYSAQISVTNGVHTVNSSQPIEVQVYGWGAEDAYSYFGGLVK